MTVIAGFKCSEGIVVCADSQETMGVAKRNIPKLRFEPIQHEDSAYPLAVAFCGATTNGPFVDKLVDLSWAQARTASSLDEVCSRIEETIKNTHREYGTIYQPGYMPEAELIYGVKLGNEGRLFHAVGPVVNEETKHASGGVGAYMVNFLADRMTPITLRHLIILAAYVLFQAKEHVDGCGGSSHIAVLPHKGPARRLFLRELDCITKTVECADHYLADLILECTDSDKTKEEIRTQASCAIEIISGYRQSYESEFQRWQDAVKQMEDKIKLSTSGTSKRVQ